MSDRAGCVSPAPFFWLGASADAGPLRDPMVLQLLESLLPFVEFSLAHNVPNAAHYAEVLDRIIWETA